MRLLLAGIAAMACLNAGAQDDSNDDDVLSPVPKGVVATSACASRCVVEVRDGREALINRRLVVESVLFEPEVVGLDDPRTAPLRVDLRARTCSLYQDTARVAAV